MFSRMLRQTIYCKLVFAVNLADCGRAQIVLGTHIYTNNIKENLLDISGS